MGTQESATNSAHVFGLHPGEPGFATFESDFPSSDTPVTDYSEVAYEMGETLIRGLEPKSTGKATKLFQKYTDDALGDVMSKALDGVDGWEDYYEEIAAEFRFRSHGN